MTQRRTVHFQRLISVFVSDRRLSRVTSRRVLTGLQRLCAERRVCFLQKIVQNKEKITFYSHYKANTLNFVVLPHFTVRMTLNDKTVLNIQICQSRQAVTSAHPKVA